VAFEAVAFEPVAFAAVLAVLAVLLGIALLLFLEDFAADAFREVRARLLVALRLAVAAFLEGLEAPFLRVFCDTACARNCHAPIRCFSRKPIKGSKRLTRFSSECSQYSTFSGKINDLEDFRAAVAISAGLGLNLE
jgi:hypothetical protein